MALFHPPFAALVHPPQQLAKRIHLVVVRAVRKGADLGLEITEPVRSLRNVDIPVLDEDGLGAPLDALSEVLSVVRLTGAIHFLAEFRQPWAVSFSPPEILAARLKLPHGSVTPFHVFIEGTCWVTSGTLPPIRVESGEVVIFPRADQHVLASAPGVISVPIKAIYPEPCLDRITAVKYGGTGQSTTLICGFIHLDQQFDPLLNLFRT